MLLEAVQVFFLVYLFNVLSLDFTYKYKMNIEEDESFERDTPKSRLELSVTQTVNIKPYKGKYLTETKYSSLFSRRFPTSSKSSNLQRQITWHSDIVQKDESNPSQLEVKVQPTVSVNPNGSFAVFFPSVQSASHKNLRLYSKKRPQYPDLRAYLTGTKSEPKISEHAPWALDQQHQRYRAYPIGEMETEPTNPNYTPRTTSRQFLRSRAYPIGRQETEPIYTPHRVSNRPIQVKVYDLDGRQSTVTVSPNERVSKILSRVPNYSIREMRLSYNNCELDPDLTFAFQEVLDGGEIYTELVLTLRCQTANGAVTLTEAGTVSIAKVKMDAVVAAGLDVKDNYKLLSSTTVLADNATVLSAGLSSSSLLQLRSAVAANAEPIKAQGLLQSAFSSVVPGSNIIVTKVPVAQLVQQGFRRHILDPIMFYKMTLLYGRAAEDVKTENDMITVSVEVVSWGSLSLSIDPHRTVQYMKQQLAEKIKIPEYNQSIIFNGQLLQDSSTLQSCGLADGYSVILTCTGDNAYLLLPLEYFDPAGDFDYTEYTSPPNFGDRGGQDYFPPCGWFRYGLKVTGKFENDIWLGSCNGPGEWIVSYHGTRVEAMQSIVRTGYDISKGKAFVYGYGVYSAPHVEDAEGYATPFVWEGRNYKLVFMNRVNPAPRALKKTRDLNPYNPDYYVSTTDRDIRPYGILLKPI